MKTIYMDESGFTGQDLTSTDQPVFVQASTDLSNEESREIYERFFSGVQAQELKHSVLSRRESGRARIVKFVQSICKDNPKRFATWFAHKEFALLSYMVDLWVENAMHEDGVDLYEDGGNLALANLSFFGLRTFQSPDFLRSHLVRFQAMMISRTPASFRAFMSAMRSDLERVDARSRDLLLFYFASGLRLGYQHLTTLPKRSIDPAMSGAVFICGNWRKRTKEPLSLVHDQSSTLIKDRAFWDIITSSAVDTLTIGMPDRALIYPLNIASTEFGDSKEHLQLQFCDLVAGAVVAYLKRYTSWQFDGDYSNALEMAGLDSLRVGCIWPELKVTPEALGTRGMSGKPLDNLVRSLLKLPM